VHKRILEKFQKMEKPREVLPRRGGSKLRKLKPSKMQINLKKYYFKPS